METDPTLSSLPLSQHFCLADGRTAALVTSSGVCNFWCAPAFDSQLRLAGVLDAAAGGSVGVLPLGRHRPRARWAGGSNLVRIEWSDSVTVTCGLVDDGEGRSALAFLVDGPAAAEVMVELGSAEAGGGGGWAVTGRRAEMPGPTAPDGPGGPLLLVASQPLRSHPGGAALAIPPGGALVWLEVSRLPGDPTEMALRVARDPAGAVASVRARMAQTTAAADAWLAGLGSKPELGPVLRQAPRWARDALVRSLLTLRGLQDRASGLVVASPLTSIPQWPGSERAWDYRYAWLRDCADAGLALVHAGATGEARRLALGLAGRLVSRGQAPVARLDGGQLPPEHLLLHLSGYGGGVVRIGNAAAGQVQVDTLGEVMRFIEALDSAGACPTEVLGLVPELAAAAASSWRQPDHGIWEVRGSPRHYLHSKLLAWAALDAGIKLASRGRVPAEASWGWRREREQIATAIRASGTDARGVLKMAFDDGSADSSSLAAYVIGYLDPGSERASATLDAVSAELGEGPLLARHRPERDGFPSPCAPFLFTSLWAVIAESRLGRRAAALARLHAIVDLAGPAGQLSEVALPAPPTLLGNYPQVQSQAALVEAILAVFAAP